VACAYNSHMWLASFAAGRKGSHQLQKSGLLSAFSFVRVREERAATCDMRICHAVFVVASARLRSGSLWGSALGAKRFVACS
jgi:hypothetical protein